MPFGNHFLKACRMPALLALMSSAALAAPAPAPGPAYRVFVSNEKSGDLTVINGDDFSVMGKIDVGKRPRGIHASPDGKTLYVALSGTPIGGPPRLDARGNPIFERGKDDDEDDADADKSADGIGIVDVAAHKLVGKIAVGSDPEEFSVSRDGTRLYVSNEDVKTASVVNITAGKVEHIIPVSQEPEGVTTTPDGRQVYITCEAGGDIFVFDTVTFTTVGHFKVEGRPRSVDFLPGSAIGFVPSESVGQVNVIDTTQPKVLKVITLPKGSRPMRVRVALDGRKVYVSNGRAGTVSVLDSRSYELLDTITVGTRPWGIALSPDGKYLYAANGPSNDVSVVDLQTNKEIKRIAAGQSPWGIAIAPRPR